MDKLEEDPGTDATLMKLRRMGESDSLLLDLADRLKGAHFVRIAFEGELQELVDRVPSDLWVRYMDPLDYVVARSSMSAEYVQGLADLRVSEYVAQAAAAWHSNNEPSGRTVSEWASTARAVVRSGIRGLKEQSRLGYLDPCFLRLMSDIFTSDAEQQAAQEALYLAILFELPVDMKCHMGQLGYHFSLASHRGPGDFGRKVYPV